jgi:hypothetical protein
MKLTIVLLLDRSRTGPLWRPWKSLWLSILNVAVTSRGGNRGSLDTSGY